MRRLPVYLLIDVSSSMRGEPIAAVNSGIDTLIKDLMRNPYALETAFISIITYGTEAQQIIPLTEVYKFRKPEIEAKGRSALGAGLELLCQCIDQEVQRSTPEQKGDWRPLVFLLCDGGHSGPIAKPIAEFKKAKVGTVVACATGEKSHFDTLKKITENIIYISSASPGNISSFFKWVTGTVSASAMSVGRGDDTSDDISALPPLPDNITVYTI